MPIDVLLYSDSGAGGGAERWLVTVARHLVRAGFGVVVAHPFDGPHLPERLAGIGVTSVTRGFERLAEDGEHAPGLTEHAEPSAIFAALEPKIVLFSDATPVANIAAKEAAHGANLPYISVAHLGGVHPGVRLDGLQQRLHNVYANATSVIGVSSHTVTQLRRFSCHPLPTALTVFNGIDDIFFDGNFDRSGVRSRLGFSDSEIVGVSVGRVDSHKGFAILSNAMARVVSTISLRWLWVGGGPGLTRARASTALQGGHLQLLGERDDVASILNAADLFALPTYRDSFCLAAVEAMASGLAVAVSDVDGISEVTGQVAHLLSDPNVDATRTTQQLIEIITRWSVDATARKELGEQGRARAETEFRESRMGAKYVDLVHAAIRTTEGGVRT